MSAASKDLQDELCLVTVINYVVSPLKYVKFSVLCVEQECPADKSDDGDDNTVPIAVGAALGGLVLIVLIAYIIGRRRSTSGYEQV